MGDKETINDRTSCYRPSFRLCEARTLTDMASPQQYLPRDKWWRNFVELTSEYKIGVSEIKEEDGSRNVSSQKRSLEFVKNCR